MDFMHWVMTWLNIGWVLILVMLACFLRICIKIRARYVVNRELWAVYLTQYDAAKSFVVATLGITTASIKTLHGGYLNTYQYVDNLMGRLPPGLPLELHPKLEQITRGTASDPIVVYVPKRRWSRSTRASREVEQCRLNWNRLPAVPPVIRQYLTQYDIAGYLILPRRHWFLVTCHLLSLGYTYTKDDLTQWFLRDSVFVLDGERKQIHRLDFRNTRRRLLALIYHTIWERNTPKTVKSIIHVPEVLKKD
jgi:hypothetical protein